MATRQREKAIRDEENRDTRPHAHARHIRISPTKVRVVLDIIRGKSVNEALSILENTPKSASEVLIKLINSAAANAEHNQNMSRSDLMVAEIFADVGPTLKRGMPRARGRYNRILKRTTHITVILDSMKEVK